MPLVSCQSCGPTACGNTSSKEKAREVSSGSTASLLSFHGRVLHLLMGIPVASVPLYTHACPFCVCRAYNHFRVPGQRWDPVET